MDLPTGYSAISGGHFFEVYGENAKILAQEFNITVIFQNVPGGESVAMCGFLANFL